MPNMHVLKQSYHSNWLIHSLNFIYLKHNKNKMRRASNNSESSNQSWAKEQIKRKCSHRQIVTDQDPTTWANIQIIKI